MFRHWKHFTWGPGWEEHEKRHRRRAWRRPKYNVPVNIIERDTEYEVRVHAITYPKDQIKVAVVDHTLYISGTRTPEGDSSPNFFLQEYPIKSFERSFELSDRVDKANIKATHKDGILIITVPKTAEAQSSQVDIDVE